MKATYNWLKDYINIEISVEELVKKITSAGLLVEGIEKHGDDSVFDIEITSNRPDWLSMIGIARELSALTGQDKKPVKIYSPKAKDTEVAEKPSFTIEIEDKEACSRYVGKVIRDVKIAESPDWIKKYLEAVGSRLVNNAADITNFCLFETGQPLHAFDLDKLEGGKLIVRRAKKGEEIVTIDGITRKLDKSILVIADAKKPVAIAGIMGGLGTEVNEKTKNILLESAYFDPVTIRRASRKLGVTTESNYRFERKVDIENVMFSSDRAALLLEELTGGKVQGSTIDVNYTQQETYQIEMNVEFPSKLIGADISKKEIIDILSALDFKVTEDNNSGVLKIEVPGFRSDVRIAEDLVEEIIRIWGYDRIEPAMPAIKAHVEPAQGKLIEYKDKIRQIMLGLGLDEVVTYTLSGKNALIDSKTLPEKPVSIQNPLSSEQEYMKSSLLPAFLKVINNNLNRKIKEIKIFELGKIYEQVKEGFNEREMLGIGVCGTRYANWQDHVKKLEFYDLKGLAEALAARLGIKNLIIKRKSFDFFSLAESVELYINDQLAGCLGKVDKKVLKNFDISEDVFFAQIQIDKLVKAVKTDYRYTALNKYPSAARDIALVVNESVSCAEALDIIKTTAGDLAVNVELFDVYQGDQVPKGSKSLAYSIVYQSPDRTLTDEEVSDLHGKVQETLLTRLKASLR
ncbi:MAG: phenylalanine--tRNA ligase subunit beta [PVC group bacterium]|nr:phenylalanine--tRNA ligase subunit beta [PVC group bacterium]